MRKRDRLSGTFASVRADMPPQIDVTDRVMQTIASLPQNATRRDSSSDTATGLLEEIYPAFRYCALAAAGLALAVIVPALQSWETLSSPVADFVSIADTFVPGGQSWLGRD